jgi:recombinational DNA repair ATPase RecF
MTKPKDEAYDQLVREYKELLTNLDASNTELKTIGQDFIEFGKDIINKRGTLSFDKESIDSDVSRVMALIHKHDELIGKKQEMEKRLDGFGPLPKL